VKANFSNCKMNEMPSHFLPFGDLTRAGVFVGVRKGNDEIVESRLVLRTEFCVRTCFGRVVAGGRFVGIDLVDHFLASLFRQTVKPRFFTTSDIDRLQSYISDH
jgi:hypothetical protein